MPELIGQLDEAVAKGELEPWKAALLKEWLLAGDTTAPGPSAEDLARLLVNPAVFGRLQAAVAGPWQALLAQARSILAHERVGPALETIGRE